MALVYITRRERFNAAHQMYNPAWTQEKNEEIFGKCANKNWHGHNYELFVTVKGEPNPDTGYCVDLKTVSDIIKTEIIEKVDHRNINLDVDFMQGKLASTENLTLAFWQILATKIEQLGAKLHCIKVYESENNFVEYFGE
jgi:6-pyruvoyltetrahydropterin/6-carboxytetrahydropterin synthase